LTNGLSISEIDVIGDDGLGLGTGAPVGGAPRGQVQKHGQVTPARSSGGGDIGRPDPIRLGDGKPAAEVVRHDRLGMQA
jgi:hypothetical protein